MERWGVWRLLLAPARWAVGKTWFSSSYCYAATDAVLMGGFCEGLVGLNSSGVDFEQPEAKPEVSSSRPAGLGVFLKQYRRLLAGGPECSCLIHHQSVASRSASRNQSPDSRAGTHCWIWLEDGPDGLEGRGFIGPRAPCELISQFRKC